MDEKVSKQNLNASFQCCFIISGAHIQHECKHSTKFQVETVKVVDYTEKIQLGIISLIFYYYY